MKLFSTKIAELFTKSEGFSKKQDYRPLFKLILWDRGDTILRRRFCPRWIAQQY
jgi:hypothetical protein